MEEIKKLKEFLKDIPREAEKTLKIKREPSFRELPFSKVAVQGVEPRTQRI